MRGHGFSPGRARAHPSEREPPQAPEGNQTNPAGQPVPVDGDHATPLSWSLTLLAGSHGRFPNSASSAAMYAFRCANPLLWLSIMKLSNRQRSATTPSCHSPAA